MQFSTAFITAAIASSALALPTIEERYVPGSCGVHVTQWQKNENGVGGAYQFDVVIKDAVGDIMGGASRLAIADYGSASVGSELPYTLVITAGQRDSDPVGFAYAGYKFSSSNGCSTGKYDSGNREMDCGFNC